MERKAQDENSLFDGNLNADIRKQLKDKRLKLGLPYQILAQVFGVDWSTIRKWERGPTMRCSVTMRPRLLDFLKGKYDKILKAENKSGSISYTTGLPSEVLNCMERFGKAYQLLRYRPELRENLLINVEKITNEALKNMIERKPATPGKN